jgi:hypothetical protein
MFPAPTAIPRLAKIKPQREEKRSVPFIQDIQLLMDTIL